MTPDESIAVAEREYEAAVRAENAASINWQALSEKSLAAHRDFRIASIARDEVELIYRASINAFAGGPRFLHANDCIVEFRDLVGQPPSDIVPVLQDAERAASAAEAAVADFSERAVAAERAFYAAGAATFAAKLKLRNAVRCKAGLPPIEPEKATECESRWQDATLNDVRGLLERIAAAMEKAA